MAEQPPPPPGFVPVEPRPPGGPPQGFIPVEEVIDRRSGAPAQVRLAVGSAPTEKDRLSTLQRYYPDAQPYKGSNFLFADPQTKRQTLYNPRGLDFGDVASAAPEVGEMAGGTLGAALGAMQSVPTGGATAPYAIPAGMGLGAAAGRESTIALARALLGTQDTRSMGQRVADIGITGGLNAVGARIGELASNGLRSGIRGLTGSARAPGADMALRTAQDIGVDLPPGAVTGSTATQRMEKGLAVLPGATDIVQRAYTNATEQLGRASDRVGRALTGGETAPLTKEGAGDVIRQGAKNAVERFGARQDELYTKAYDLVGKDNPSRIDAVQRFVGELEGQIAKAPESERAAIGSALDRAKRILADARVVTGPDFKDLEGYRVPFEVLRNIRTALGKDLETPLAMEGGGASNAKLKQLYGALSEDIGAAARATSPEADRAMRLADRYTRFNLGDMAGRIPNADILQKVIDDGTGEAAYKYATAGLRDGGSRLEGLRRNIRPQEWDAVAATVWDQMGRSKPGQAAFSGVDDIAGEFSPQTFVTNWNSLAPEAKKTLFTSTRYARMADDMDKVGRTAQRLNDAAKQSNFSNSANVGMAAGSIYAGIGAIVTGDLQTAAAMGLGGVLVPRGVAMALMENPKFVNWLAKVPVGNDRAVAEHLGRLGVIAAAEPTIRDEVRDFESALREAPAIKAVQKR